MKVQKCRSAAVRPNSRTLRILATLQPRVRNHMLGLAVHRQMGTQPTGIRLNGTGMEAGGHNVPVDKGANATEMTRTFSHLFKSIRSAMYILSLIQSNGQRRDKGKGQSPLVRCMTTISVTRQGSECLYMRCIPFSYLTYRCSGHSLHHFFPSFPHNAAPNPEDNHNAVRTYTSRR